MKVYPYVAGTTLGAHNTFLEKLKKKGAKVVKSSDDCKVIIVFCPIISRFETDVSTALSSTPEKGNKDVILVAMHHTFDKDYTIPSHQGYQNVAIKLLVDCLFFEKTGYLKCERNKEAVKTVSKALGLSKWWKKGKTEKKEKKEKKGKKMKVVLSDRKTD